MSFIVLQLDLFQPLLPRSAISLKTNNLQSKWKPGSLEYTGEDRMGLDRMKIESAPSNHIHRELSLFYLPGGSLEETAHKVNVFISPYLEHFHS